VVSVEENPSIERLGAFLAARTRLLDTTDGLAKRLEAYLAQAKPLLAMKLNPASVEPAPQDPMRLEQALAALRDPLRTARGEGATIIPAMMAALRQSEVDVTAMLAKLWSPALGGEASVLFLDAFLRRLGGKSEGELPNLERLGRRGYSVTCELCPLGDRQDRVDMVVEADDFMIGIEVKINADEGHAQLDRYVEALRRRAQGLGKEAPYLVFLSRFKPPSDRRLIHALWSDVSAAARATLPRARRDWSVQHNFIHAFANHIDTF
jgi:hypothetical protein